ncbi:disks large-associated protein 4-like [Saccostrea cucullata]|uniref:disks large-associated protein 4-like n=1 Tax=Saccostrea cuccullata TaxID=36930 RepID=UPI002ED37C5F
MDTLAPQSVLDHRSNKKESHLVSDHITRQKSASGVQNRDPETEEEIDVRIPQPYRTSFSAVLTPAKVKKERSRSTTPTRVLTSSMKSEHGATARKVSPKHVTYDAKVTVRHSDSFEHETDVLQGEELNSSIDPAFDPSFTECDSPREKTNYSTKIKEMTELIVKEYPVQNGVDVTDSSQNNTKRVMGRQNAKNGMANGGSPTRQKPMPPVNELSREYEHDRTVSYRQAITNKYSEEVKRLAEAKIEERFPPGGRITHNNLVKDVKAERSNSVPSHPGRDNSNRLTPTKRSVGGSIGNFFRKLSPRLGRKSPKDKGSTSSMDTAGSQQEESFSRNKVRSSFLKLMGRSKRRSNSQSRSQDSLDDFTADREAGFVQDEKPNQIPTASNRILKSIEQNTIAERDVYQRFKEKQSPKSLSEDPQPQGEGQRQSRPQAMRATAAVSPPGMNKENLTEMDGPSTSGEHYKVEPQVRVASPNSVDVHVASKPPRILQTSVLSSNEDSIGNCSLDNTVTDSESSLNQGGSSNDSKLPALGSRENTIRSESALGPTRGDRYSEKVRSASENGAFFTNMPKLASTADVEFKECTNTPSYLKLSCAVSGYGRYSQYSSYKSIEKRSPYSSCSSLQSDYKMPVTRVTSPMRRTSASNSTLELGLICPQPLVYDNGLVTNGASGNGQGVLPDEHYPTGDKQQDGEYFLRLTQQWEDRLTSHCRQIEGDLESPSTPEDVRGKIRAAVGKANLLISQKFKQFRELCAEHMNPSEDGKVLKWADLQGFWDMIKIQADNIDDHFAELDLMRQNGWKELAVHSRGSSVNSSPKSGSISLSNGSTPSGTPGSRRKTPKAKDTPDSSPERTEKMRAAAKAREEARKKMLADRRAAMKQKQKQEDVEIFVS